jgi:hypothetical protein
MKINQLMDPRVLKLVYLRSCENDCLDSSEEPATVDLLLTHQFL